MAEGKKGYVVIGKGGDQGLEIVRHPCRKLSKAMEKAYEMAFDFPRETFYVAEIQFKVATPTEPVVFELMD